MKVIYKYPLEITDNQVIELPKDSGVLTVQMQNNQLCLWALVDTEQTQRQQVPVKVFGTGNPVDFTGPWQYVSTVQERIFVWHIFIGEAQ